METITVEIPDPVYRDFQDFAKRVDRPVSKLIQEAMELYRDQKIGVYRDQTTAPNRMSLMDMPTFSVGKILKPLGPDDDLLGEMLKGSIE
jgi:hypothetical protein